MQDTLTAQQEGFSQTLVGGVNQSDAYRANYDTANMLPATVHEEASRLAAHPKIAARISELKAAYHAIVEAKWELSAEKFVEEAKTNLDGARSSGQWSAANGALQLAGKATGILVDVVAATDRPINVTKVTIVLNQGDGTPVVIDSTAREVPELEDGGDGSVRP